MLLCYTAVHTGAKALQQE